MTSAEHVASLNQTFGLPGVLQFEMHPGAPTLDGGLIRAQITLPGAAATVYLHGAHLTHFQPAGQAPVLFLSERSDFAPMKAIRGGIPICFPWFGPYAGGEVDGKPAPSHGFARLLPWQVAFAALLPSSKHAEDDLLQLTLLLEPDPGGYTRLFGWDRFRLTCEFTIGRTLTMRLSALNLGDKPLRLEEALHSYFHVGDVRETTITGLEGALYLDKRDEMREKHAPDSPLRLTAATDRVFPGNTAAMQIQDEVLKRTIRLTKENSATTVVWNPWAELATSLKDLDSSAWQRFVCVEAANAGADGLQLEPQQAHTVQLTISTE
jgi:glucose-6-phosphate 1-epimerase